MRPALAEFSLLRGKQRHRAVSPRPEDRSLTGACWVISAEVWDLGGGGWGGGGWRDGGGGVIWRAVNSFLQLRVPDMALSVFGLD